MQNKKDFERVYGPVDGKDGDDKFKTKSEDSKKSMIEIINTTPHAISFLDEAGNTVVIQPSGHLVNAKPINSVLGALPNGVQLVRVEFTADIASEAVLAQLENEHPEAIIVGSVIAAQAFPGRVFAMIPAPGFERVPTDQKRMRMDQFTTFA